MWTQDSHFSTVVIKSIANTLIFQWPEFFIIFTTCISYLAADRAASQSFSCDDFAIFLPCDRINNRLLSPPMPCCRLSEKSLRPLRSIKRLPCVKECSPSFDEDLLMPELLQWPWPSLWIWSIVFGVFSWRGTQLFWNHKGYIFFPSHDELYFRKHDIFLSWKTGARIVNAVIIDDLVMQRTPDH